MTSPKEIGDYRIEGLLGSGGTGEVYSAVDMRTNARVAVKILNRPALADPDHRRRFLQEAKTIGLLSHPNIVRLYETGTAAVDGAETLYIAMELVEGQTLDQIIPPDGMAAREALALAMPVLSALQTAHEAGIIHRDLKPRNIIVTPANVPKILDFGLAKRTAAINADPAAETVSIAHSVTLSGSILGTAAYMSPEQADGKPTDVRSDIFSFGSILYEMVTGQRAFPGDSPMSTISAVMAKEPLALSAFPNVPPALAAVIERCLRKDPAARPQTIAGLRTTLMHVEANLDIATVPGDDKLGRRGWIAVTVAGVVGIAAGLGLGRRLWWRADPQPLRLTYRRGDVMSARFGPAGEVIYSAMWGADPLRTFVAQPGNHESRPIDLPPAWVLSVSKKSELALLLGREQTGTLARVPLGGGTPREVLVNVSWADWAPDSNSMAVVRRVGASFRLEYPVGNVLFETASRKPEVLRLSPDGNFVAFLAYDSETGDYALNVTGRDRRTSIPARGFRVVGGLAWSPSGDEVLVAGARTGESPAIYRIGREGGERIAYSMPGWPHLLDCAPDGRVLLAAVTSRLGIAALTPFSKSEQDLAWLDGSRVNGLSMDGSLLLFTEINSGGGRNAEIYLRKTDGSPAVRIGSGNRAALSYDSRQVACLRNISRGNQVAILPAGPGEEQILKASGFRYESAECHPDGQRVLFNATRDREPRRAYLQPIGGGEAVPVTPAGVALTRLSPSGKMGVAANNGKLEVWPLEGGEARTVSPLRHGEQICGWSEDGKALFLATAENGGSSIELTRIEIAGGRRQTLRRLTPMEPGAVFWGLPALSGDGGYYAASFRKDLSELYLVSGIL